jgi:exonuclease III
LDWFACLSLATQSFPSSTQDGQSLSTSRTNVPRFGDLFEKKETENIILGGDLNVVERGHIPHYHVFGEWEYAFYESFLKFGLADAYRTLHPDTQDYSWFGKEGDGYRFDHLFVSRNLVKYISECHYIHIPRVSKLGDHSAMYLTIGMKPSS